MKEKLSITLSADLLKFLDRLPGSSRSAKLEQVLRDFRMIWDERRLRKALAAHRDEEAAGAEHEAWRRTMEHDQWSE